MSVSTTYQSVLSVVEQLPQNSIPDAAPAANPINHNAWNRTNALNATSSPPVSQVAAFQQALTAGAATVDLTNLPGTAGTVSLNGLKVQQVKLQNPITNANPITIAPGGANPYLMFGAGFSVTLAPGQECLFDLAGVAPTVGAGAKNLALTGTGVQALNIQIVGG